jgi:hypothetical protein
METAVLAPSSTLSGKKVSGGGEKLVSATDETRDA